MFSGTIPHPRLGDALASGSGPLVLGEEPQGAAGRDPRHCLSAWPTWGFPSIGGFPLKWMVYFKANAMKILKIRMIPGGSPISGNLHIYQSNRHFELNSEFHTKRGIQSHAWPRNDRGCRDLHSLCKGLRSRMALETWQWEVLMLWL